MRILRASYLKQNIGAMLIFFFKIYVNVPQLSWFVVLVAVNGVYWPGKRRTLNLQNRQQMR